jgi:hypothetical protein
MSSFRSQPLDSERLEMTTDVVESRHFPPPMSSNVVICRHDVVFSRPNPVAALLQATASCGSPRDPGRRRPATAPMLPQRTLAEQAA